jgi:hypothetical protein
MINQNNLPEAISILIGDNFTFSLLIKSFPEIRSELVSAKSSVNSPAIHKVLQFFSDKLKKDPNLLNNFIVDGEFFNKKLAVKAQNTNDTNNYSGRVTTVEKSEDAWRAFSDSLRGKIFRSFSIIEREDSIVVYFL